VSITAIILAAGKGTRMKSDRPKVLHEVCGQPMLAHVLDACRQAGAQRVIVVVGHRAELVREQLADYDGELTYVVQSPQLGTGHAVMVCQEPLADLSGPVLVLAGDGPLLRAETLRELIAVHQEKRAACTLATSILPEPGSYGRILRDENDELVGIVENLDATDEQKAIREVNVSLYCFDAESLRDVLGKLTNDNSKGEYYLTDALAILRAEGKKLAAVAAVPPEDTLSINTLDELAQVDAIMTARLAGQEGA